MENRYIKEAEAALNAEIEGIRKRFQLDVEAGQRDAHSNIFDSWYREHRKDNGAAYLAGWHSEYKEGTIQFI